MSKSLAGPAAAVATEAELESPWALAQEFSSELALPRDGEAQYLECRLAEGCEQVDYLCAISRAMSKPFEIALRAYVSQQQVDGGPAWRSTFALLDEWDGGGSPIVETTPGVWLEFDDVGSGRRFGRPSVSIGLVPGYRPQRPLNPCNATRHVRTALASLRALEYQPSANESSLLASCFNELAERGRWIYISLMLGRDPTAIKLYGTMPRSALLPYLDSIGWAGDTRDVARLMLQAYGPDLVGDEMFIDLNLDNLRDASRCSLGLAISQQHLVRGPDRDPRRHRVLERWIALGLASPEKAGRYQAGLGDAGDSPSDGRFLDLKLVWQARRDPIAKAYLGSCRLQRGARAEEGSRLADEGRIV